MSGIIVDIILFLIVAGNAVFGYKKGLAGVIFNICSTIVAIILVFILYKPATNYIINHTKTAEKLEAIFEEKLQGVFENKNRETTEQLPENSNINSMIEIFIGENTENRIEDATDNIINDVAVQISHKIISVMVFFMLFTAIRLGLYVLRNSVEWIANLPIIGTINHSGGMIYGVIKGFLVVYILLAILSVILPVVNSTSLIAMIQSAPIGSKMFQNNIILNVIFRFL